MTTFQTSGGSGRAPAAAEAAIAFARPRDRLDYHVPLGLCEDYAADSRQTDVVRRDLEVCRATGVRVLRVSLPWESIEPQPGRYNLRFWDELIRMAVVEHGITLIPYVCYGPRWACGGSKANFWKNPPRNPDDFGRLMFMLAGRYRDRIGTWELWNEPDNPDFWTGSVADYARLLEAGSRGVKSANPRARVVLGGIAHNLDWLEELMSRHEASRHADIVNIHNYFETWVPHALEDITGFVNRASDIICRYGDNQPLWMAEVGYSSHRRGSKVSHFCRARYDYEHTRTYQAAQLVKTLTLLLATQKLSLIAWYEIKDLPSRTDVIGDQNNRHLGIRGINYEMKPAALALSFFDRLFGRSCRSIDSCITTRTLRGPEPRVHGFRFVDGGAAMVAWLPVHDGHGEIECENGRAASRRRTPARDERQTDFELHLAEHFEGRMTLYDAVGRAIGCGVARRGNQGTHLCDLHLKGGEVLIARFDAE